MITPNLHRLIDSHVHCHASFRLDEFLDQAARNIQLGARQLGISTPITGYLMLTERWGEHLFREVWQPACGQRIGPWLIRATAEACSIAAVGAGDISLFVVSGRQIVTRERLEVLGLGCMEEFPEGEILRDTVGGLLSVGALPIVPWGFGKWIGRRGAVVRELLESDMAHQIYLGDNGGRPAWSLVPPLFRLAQQRGVPILPGSDPLPFPGQVRRVGSLGFSLCGPWDEERPYASFRQLAELHRARHVVTFGRRVGVWEFAVSQMAMQFARRLRSPS